MFYILFWFHASWSKWMELLQSGTLPISFTQWMIMASSKCSGDKKKIRFSSFLEGTWAIHNGSSYYKVDFCIILLGSLDSNYHTIINKWILYLFHILKDQTVDTLKWFLTTKKHFYPFKYAHSMHSDGYRVMKCNFCSTKSDQSVIVCI